MKTSEVRRERELRRREGYREIILHAAERVILRKGYSALTMDDVAREAQLSKATIYKYVAGKGGPALRDPGPLVRRDPGADRPAIRRRARRAPAKSSAGSSRSSSRAARTRSTSTGSCGWTRPCSSSCASSLAPPGKAGAASAGRPQDAGHAQAEAPGASIDAGRPDPRRRRGLRRIPAHGHRPGRGLSSRPSSRATPTCASGRGTRRSRPGAAEGVTRFIIEGIRNPEQTGKEK